MELKDVREGLRVRLLGPEDHELRDVTGVVGRVFSRGELWERRPSDMMTGPFAWLSGQVLVSLDSRPRGGPLGLPWTPLVEVRPEDIEAAE